MEKNHQKLNTLTVNNDVEKVHTDQHFTECLRIGLLPTISFASRSDLIGQTARVCLDQVAKNCKYSRLVLWCVFFYNS